MIKEETKRESVLGSQGRREFWDALSKACGLSEETRGMVLQARPPVSRLCRFRTVGSNSLSQLRTNTLSFSSSLFYDDPLDTFFYVDKEALRAYSETIATMGMQRSLDMAASLLRQANLPGFGKLCDIMEAIEMDGHSFFFDQLNCQIDSIRRIVQGVGYSLCFCDDPLNEVLWLKYANNHKGFVQVYDVNDPVRLLCGKEDSCRLCVNSDLSPAPYPVYYLNEGFDATRYALVLLLLREMPAEVRTECPELVRWLEGSIRWEFEKVTLVKHRQHEYDCEWRLLCRGSAEGRPSIQMMPSSVILGLRMEDDERRDVVDAAKDAGVKTILHACIDEKIGKLAIRPYWSAC